MRTVRCSGLRGGGLPGEGNKATLRVSSHWPLSDIVASYLLSHVTSLIYTLQLKFPPVFDTHDPKSLDF